MFCYNPAAPRFAKVVVRDNEVRTQNNLAFDLKDMDELRERGVPISNQTLADSFYDGDPSGNVDNFNIAPELTRGFDMNDVWNLSKESHEKITKAKLKQVGTNVK